MAKTIIKKLKPHKEKRVMYELSFLLPSYAFIYEQLDNIQKYQDTKTDERLYFLAQEISKEIMTKSIYYKNFHKKAVTHINILITKYEIQSLDTNSFIVGISLLLYYFEIKDKVIKLDNKLIDYGNEVFDYFASKDEIELLNHSSTFSELIFNDLDSNL